MAYCMCKENFEKCSCDFYLCPKHKGKRTERPPTPMPEWTNIIGDGSADINATFTTSYTTDSQGNLIQS